VFDLIAIDLDGTLVDSVGDLHEAVVRMQRAMQMEHASIEQVRSWVGNGIERLVHRALSNSMHGDAPDELHQQGLAHFVTAYEGVNGSCSCLYPGVRDGLDWLASLNTPLVVVTNKAGQFARPLLGSLGIGHYFEHQICGDDVDVKKPDPAALFLAARRCVAVPRRSVMIGDSISDIKAANAAGFAMIAVSYGYNHGYSIRDVGAADHSDAVIDSFDELPAVFERLVTSLT